MEDLKPCPFCGETEIEVFVKVLHGVNLVYAQCQRCLVKGVSNQHREEAIAAWNRREPQPEKGTFPPCVKCGKPTTGGTTDDQPICLECYEQSASKPSQATAEARFGKRPALWIHDESQYEELERFKKENTQLRTDLKQSREERDECWKAVTQLRAQLEEAKKERESAMQIIFACCQAVEMDPNDYYSNLEKAVINLHKVVVSASTSTKERGDQIEGLKTSLAYAEDAAAKGDAGRKFGTALEECRKELEAQAKGRVNDQLSNDMVIADLKRERDEANDARNGLRDSLERAGHQLADITNELDTWKRDLNCYIASAIRNMGGKSFPKSHLIDEIAKTIGYHYERSEQLTESEQSRARMREALEEAHSELVAQSGSDLLVVAKVRQALSPTGPRYIRCSEVREVLTVLDEALTECRKTFSAKCEGQHSWPKATIAAAKNSATALLERCKEEV